MPGDTLKNAATFMPLFNRVLTYKFLK